MEFMQHIDFILWIIYCTTLVKEGDDSFLLLYGELLVW